MFSLLETCIFIQEKNKASLTKLKTILKYHKRIIYFSWCNLKCYFFDNFLVEYPKKVLSISLAAFSYSFSEAVLLHLFFSCPHRHSLRPHFRMYSYCLYLHHHYPIHSHHISSVSSSNNFFSFTDLRPVLKPFDLLLFILLFL